MGSETTIRWHIHTLIFMPKIIGIEQLLLKLSLVVGCYTFLRYSVTLLHSVYSNHQL